MTTTHSSPPQAPHQPARQAPPAGPGGAAGAAGAFCRVVVVGPATRVDLALPAAVPLARLMPALARHAASGADDPAGWALCGVDGARLDPGASLAAAGVRDGSVLVLHPASEWNPPPVYDDVVELVGEGGVPHRFATGDARLACGVLAVVAVLGALGALALAGGAGSVPGALAAALAALLVLCGAALSRAAGDTAAGTVSAVLAAPSGALAAVELSGGAWGRGHLLLAGAAVLLAAVLGAVAVGGGDGVFAAVGVAGFAAVLGALVAVLGDTAPARAAAVVAPLALAVVTVLPTLALLAARLPRDPLPRAAEDLAHVAGQLDLDRTRAQVDQARRLLAGLLAGCLAATAAGVAVLVADGGRWALGLGAVLAVLALLRGRLFRAREQVWAVTAATTLTLAAGTALLLARHAPDRDALLGLALPLLLGVAVTAGAVGASVGRVALAPRVVRLGDILETLLMLSTVPLALGVWDVYDALLNLRA